MPNSWDDIAHKALDDESQPIKADATNIAKYGAPSVGVITAVLAGLLGNSWNLDPQRPGVVIAAAIIVAAVVLGVYFAFASDIRARAAVTVARFESLSTIVERDAQTLAAADASKRLLDDATAARALADAKLSAAERERDAAQEALRALNQREAQETLEQVLSTIRTAVKRGNGSRKLSKASKKRGDRASG